MKLVRESLFSSTIRSFCISFFAVIGIVLAFFLIMLAFGAGKSSKSLETSTFDIIIPESNGRKYLFTSNQPLLLRIDLVGPIATGATSSVDITAIRSILNESRSGPLKAHPIKGILLYINTPGGSAVDSESIYYALKDYSLKYQVPIYAYVEGLCASGGMMAACAADKIYTSESSIVGSVGVIISFFNVSEGMQKVGVQNQTLTAGNGKADMNPFQPWTENSSDNWKNLINQSYKDFVAIVSQARPKLTPDLLQNKYGANVFSAQDAANYGYTDGAGYQYSQAVQLLAQAAGITDNHYQVVQLQPKLKFSDFLTLSNQMMKQKNMWDMIAKNPLLFIKQDHNELLNLQVAAHHN